MDKPHIPDIVGTIKKQHITPIPKWIIMGRNFVLWGILVTLSLAGGIFLSLSVLDILDVGPDLFHSLGFRHAPILFFLAPFSWTILTGIALLLGIIAFRNTTYGYRQRILVVASLIAIALATLSAFAHLANIDDRLDRAIERSAPHFATPFFPPRALRFSDPDRGMLAGTIVETREMPASFTIKTPRSGTWTVRFAENAKKSPRLRLESGENVIVIGTPEKNEIFNATFVRPLRSKSGTWKLNRNADANSLSGAPYKRMRGANKYEF